MPFHRLWLDSPRPVRLLCSGVLRPLCSSSSAIPVAVSTEAVELLLDLPGSRYLAKRLPVGAKRGEEAEGITGDTSRAGDVVVELGWEGPASEKAIRGWPPFDIALARWPYSPLTRKERLGFTVVDVYSHELQLGGETM